MALEAVLQGGSNTAGLANVDADYQLLTNLPTSADKAGFARIASRAASGVTKALGIAEDGEARVAQTSILLDLLFAGSTGNSQNTKMQMRLTTHTKSVINGFLRLNAGLSAGSAAGAALQTNHLFNFEPGSELHGTFIAKTQGGAATNKQIDIGFGAHLETGGQGGAIVEFAGFRWTTLGGFQAVLETANSGTFTSQATAINGDVPPANDVARAFRVVVADDYVEYYMDDAFMLRYFRESGSRGLLKSAALPLMAREFASGVPSAAPVLDIGWMHVKRVGGNQIDPVLAAAIGGRSSYLFQNELTNAALATHNFPATTTAPTAVVGSNTTSAMNLISALGGFYRNTLTGISAAHANVLVTSYLNPLYSTLVQGVSTHGRTFVCMGITISPMVVTAALTGGGFVANWFAAIGATAVSLATTDTDGTTNLGTKTARLVPLSLISTLAAAAAAGVVSTDVGGNVFTFPTPLVVYPGEHLQVGFRVLQLTAAVTVGAVDGSVQINGHWL